MYRYIETLYRSRLGVVVVSSDQADAYSHVDRRGAIAAGSECCLEVEVVLRALLSKGSYHVLQGQQGIKFLRQNNGFDQGCNTSSAGYCVSSNAALLVGQSAAKATDLLAEVVSFIDDTYFIGSPTAAVAGWKAYQHKLHADLRVRENQSKRKCLPGTGVDSTQLPSELSWCVVSSMDIVGAQMDCARADRVVPPPCERVQAPGLAQVECRMVPSCEKITLLPHFRPTIGAMWPPILLQVKCAQSSSFCPRRHTSTACVHFTNMAYP